MFLKYLKSLVFFKAIFKGMKLMMTVNAKENNRATVVAIPSVYVDKVPVLDNFTATGKVKNAIIERM